jgi:hypothetical protein
MIDLIGFWSGVTLYTFLLLLIPAWCFVVVVDLWVRRITDGDVPEFLNNKLEPYLRKIGYFKKDYSCPRLSAVFYFFHYLSVVGLILTTVSYIQEGQSYVDSAIVFATIAPPFFAWITIVGGALIALDGCAKKIYKLGKKLNKALSNEN